MNINFVSIIKKIVLILLILFISNLLSAFILGFLMTIGGNVQMVGINQIAFDPLITIAYILLYYFITLFYHPNQKVQYYLFLFTLFLSFTVTFIQGAIFLVVLYFLLKKFKMI